jgi:predicted transcriptional regulator
VSVKKITPLGWLIIEKLAELKLTRKQFCLMYNVPESRLSNLITGLRPAKRYRAQVMRILNISERELDEKYK